MQSHLLLAGPVPIKGSAGTGFGFGFSSAVDWTNPSARPHRRRALVVSLSASKTNSSLDHYAVLGLSRNATSAHVRRAYRLLARKYHPDVNKDPQASEMFKSIRCAYEVLSNEARRTRYDQELKFQEDAGRPYTGKWNPSPEYEGRSRIYSWELRWNMLGFTGYWEHRNAKKEYSSDKEEDTVVEEGSTDERGPFIEVLRSALLSLFLLQTFGSRFSLTFSSLMAMLDKKLDPGYKIGYAIAWILGGRGGILLTLCLSFASWVFGKTSSSVVVLVVVAMWVGCNITRYAPLPQGALLTLLFMSIKLQVDLK